MWPPLVLLPLTVASVISLRDVKKGGDSQHTFSPILCVDAANQLLKTLDESTMTVACPLGNQFQVRFDPEKGAIILLESQKRMTLEEAHNFICEEFSHLLESDLSDLRFPICYQLPSPLYIKWLWERISLGRPDEISLICTEPSMRTFLTDHLDDPVKLGPFQNLLGKGSHGSVYSCEKDDGKRVAVKVIRLRAGYVEWLQDEIAAMKLIKDDPHFVKLHGAQVRDFTLELIFEHLDGMNGDEVIKKHGLIKDLRILAAIARKLLTGFKHLHQKGYRHDDIKYDNVFFTRDGQVKIIDLGLATKMENSFKVVGISGLGGPEHFENAFAASASSDIWMLASLLLVAHAGSKLSFYIDSWCCDVREKIINGVKDSLKALPESEFRNFLALIYQLDPSERPSIDDLLRSSFLDLAATDDELMTWIRALFTT